MIINGSDVASVELRVLYRVALDARAASRSRLPIVRHPPACRALIARRASNIQPSTRAYVGPHGLK